MIYEGSSQLGLTGNVFKMWFTCESPVELICYAESNTAAPASWTYYSSNPINLGGGGHFQSFVVHNASTYYLFAESDGTNMLEYTSANGVTAWINVHGAGNPTLVKGSAGSVDSTGIYNMSVINDGTTWRMVYEAQGTGYSGYECLGASSPDLTTWTKDSTIPVAIGNGTGGPAYGCGGPDLHLINGRYWLWTHSNSSGVISQLRRFTSNRWGQLFQLNPGSLSSPNVLTYQQGSSDEGVGSGVGQVADPVLIEVSGSVYMFYSANSDQVFPGTPGVDFHQIKLAIYSGTFAQLVATSEGMTTNTP